NLLNLDPNRSIWAEAPPDPESEMLSVQAIASGVGLNAVVLASDTASPGALEMRSVCGAFVKLLRSLVAPNESHCPVPAAPSASPDWGSRVGMSGAKIVAENPGSAPNTIRPITSSAPIHGIRVASDRDLVMVSPPKDVLGKGGGDDCNYVVG